jgi:hypothetical protein
MGEIKQPMSMFNEQFSIGEPGFIEDSTLKIEHYVS